VTASIISGGNQEKATELLQVDGAALYHIKLDEEHPITTGIKLTIKLVTATDCIVDINVPTKK
jgi:hypothetical protein